jgi:hypothetical protein
MIWLKANGLSPSGERQHGLDLAGNGFNSSFDEGSNGCWLSRAHIY